MPYPPSRMEKLKALVASLLGPGGAPAQAMPMGQVPTIGLQPMPQQMPQPMQNAQQQSPMNAAIMSAMASRKAALDRIGGAHTGGMFDIIYKKRKETEDALKDIGL